jgi:hypothetical protein
VRREPVEAVTRVALGAAVLGAAAAAVSAGVALVLGDADCDHVGGPVAVAIWLGSAGAGCVSLLAVAYGRWVFKPPRATPPARRLRLALGVAAVGLAIWAVAFFLIAGLSFGC